jgi:hypothetical protein
MIKIREHKSSSYAPRTYHNASQGVTLAIAADFTTAGEKLTTKAAAGKIVHIDAKNFAEEWLAGARQLFAMLRKHDSRVVNVAGNGIYTLTKYEITQVMMNDYVRRVLHQVDQHWKLDKVVSGGQTGADLAGLIAAAKIGIECEGMWPAGYKMRFEDGVDRNHTPEQIMEIVNAYAD